MSQYVLLEKNSDGTISPIFGTFKTYADAAEFAHSRIAMFCNEWSPLEDGFLLERLSWEIKKLSAWQ